MSEMIKRVARAIFVAADDAHNTWPTPDHPECVKMARAAITAMREPTEAMIKRGDEVEWYDGDDRLMSAGAYNAEKIFQAMIDTALAEGGE